MTLDLVFPAFGNSLATDHAYALYGALSGVVPRFHEDDSPLRFAPITGTATPDGRLHLTEQSCLRVRMPEETIRAALPLAGKRLSVGDAHVRLGVPSIRALVTAPAVAARLVTFKNANTPEQFLTTARAKLAELGVEAVTSLPVHVAGDHAGQPKRRVVRIKGVTVPGYALTVTGLSPEDSQRLQQSGLGGRTRLGCGFFLPI